MTRAGQGDALVVDCHVHLLKPDWNSNMEEGLEGLSESWARQVRWYYGPKADPRHLLDSIARCWDPTGERLVARMDEAGVDTSVLMPMDHTWAFPDPEVIPIAEKNRLCRAACANHPGRIYTFAGVDPRRPDALAILRESLDEGAIGLKLYPTDGFYPDDEVVYPLYALCTERDVPVLFHTGHSAGRQKSKYSHPMYIDAVAADFPDLRLVMGHSGRFEAWSDRGAGRGPLQDQHLPGPLALAALHLAGRARAPAGLDPRPHRHRPRPLRQRHGGHRRVAEPRRVGRPRCGRMPEWANQLGFRLTPDEVDLVLGENCRRCYRIPDEARASKRARAT